MISSANICHLTKLSAPDSFNVPKLHQSCIKFLGKCFKESIAIYAPESLGEKFLASLFLQRLQPISDLLDNSQFVAMEFQHVLTLNSSQEAAKDFLIVVGDEQIEVSFYM